MQNIMSLSRHYVLLVFLIVPSLVFSQPVTIEDFLEKAREHFERRRFLNALDSLRIVLEMTESMNAREYRPKYEAEILAAESLKALGRIEEAANMYERSMVHGYEEKTVFAFLAHYFDKHKRFEPALAYYRKYYAVDKADVMAHIRYAALLGRLKRRDEARQVLEGIEPKTTAQTAEKCELMERQKKNRDAFQCFRALRESRPDKEQNFLALYRLAMALKDRPQVQENAEWLYYLFGAEPRYIWPLIELKITQRKFYDARLLLEEIIRIRGKDSDAERLLANLEVQAGRALEKPFRATRKEMEMLEPGIK